MILCKSHIDNTLLLVGETILRSQPLDYIKPYLARTRSSLPLNDNQEERQVSGLHKDPGARSGCLGHTWQQRSAVFSVILVSVNVDGVLSTGAGSKCRRSSKPQYELLLLIHRGSPSLYVYKYCIGSVTSD